MATVRTLSDVECMVLRSDIFAEVRVRRLPM